MNYSKRTDCFKCHLAKPEDTGDFENRLHSSKDLSVMDTRQLDIVLLTLLRVSDTVCVEPYYSGHNLTFVMHVVLVSMVTSLISLSSSNSVRDGDWTCSSCGGNNFSRRIDCYRCKTAKPAVEAW